MRTSSVVLIDDFREHVTSAERIAKQGGRVTPTRLAVLDALARAGRPLSHDEVATVLASANVEHDRVTLYRTLDWLVRHALAHRVAGGDRVWRFSTAINETHGHAHFHCARCGSVFCMEILQPAITMPLPCGFESERTELTFHGRCPGCH